MKIHQFFIISCHFILLVCYISNSKAQTVGGAAPDNKLKFTVSEGKPCQNTTLAPENCRLGVLYKQFIIKCSPKENMTIDWYYLTDGDKSQNDKYMPMVTTDDGRVKVFDAVENHVKIKVLEFTHLGPMDTNFYSCRATTTKSTSQKENLAPVLQEIFEIQALPQVSAPLKDMTVIEDNQINVTCTVYGKASHVVWKFGEKELLNGTDNRVKLDTFKNVLGASLLISRANMTDRGMYNCTAVSYYGNSTESAGTFVRIKSKYAALGPFLGICAEVIILCTIILIYEKKRDKTELEESDTDQGPETKSSPDHGQDSVRYRK